MPPKLLLLPLLTLTACFWGDDWDTEHLTGRYYVLGNGPQRSETEWHDAQLYFDDEQYGYAEPLIRPNLAAVRFNDAFIVAETAQLLTTRQQTRIARQYYLVPVSPGKSHFQAVELVQGPFDRQTCYRELARRNGGDTLLPETRRFFTPHASDFSKL
jgi:hypothetical protein